MTDQIRVKTAVAVGENKNLPQTVLDAVDRLFSVLPDDTKARVVRLAREDMFFFASLPGVDLHRVCGVCEENEALLADCVAWANSGVLDSEWEVTSLYEPPDPDEALRTILEALWDALHGWPAPEAIEPLDWCDGLDDRGGGLAWLRALP